MKLLVRNLSRKITEQQLLALFNDYGEVVSCDLVLDKENGQSKGFGFVTFADTDAAEAAIKALNGSKQSGNKIRVKSAEEDAPTASPEASESIWPQPSEGES